MHRTYVHRDEQLKMNPRPYFNFNHYFSIMSFEVANVLKGKSGKELNEIRIGCSEHLPTIAETTLLRG